MKDDVTGSWFPPIAGMLPGPGTERDALAELRIRPRKPVERPTSRDPKPDLALAWLLVLPDPLSEDEDSVHSWFRWMEVLHDPREPDGLTVKQVAARIGVPTHEQEVEAILRVLANRDDLIVKRSGKTRYVARSPERAIGQRIRTHLARQAPVFERFDLAVLEYQVDGRALQWSRLKEAFLALVKSRTGWPADVLAAVERDPERWLLAAAEIVPPSHVPVEDELTQLRAANARLVRELAEWRQPRTENEGTTRSAEGGKKAQLREQLERLEREVRELRERVTGLEEELEDYRQHDPRVEGPETLLDGTGRGGWPAGLKRETVAHVRELIVETRADRRIQLAMVRKLGEIFTQPRRFTRLTSQGFQQQRYDSVWRARVEGYRIVYGLTGEQVTILEIKKRAEVYDDVQSRL